MQISWFNWTLKIDKNGDFVWKMAVHTVGPCILGGYHLQSQSFRRENIGLLVFQLPTFLTQNKRLPDVSMKVEDQDESHLEATTRRST